MVKISQHNQHNCRALLGDLSAYLDGEAEAALCEEIERHMEGCENCRIVIDTLAKTINLYQTHGQSALPPGAKERLFVALNLEDFREE